MKFQLKFCLFVLFAHITNTLDMEPIVGIVGGRSINIEQVPWQAYIEYFTKQPYGSQYMQPSGSCGGSIISEKWVMSAAHCTPTNDLTKATVRVGSSYCNRGGKIYDVSQIINHARYKYAAHSDFDFALLELKKAITFDYQTIKPIPLAGVYDSVPENTMCFVSGWGSRSDSSSYSSYQDPKVLQGVRVPIVSNAKCKQIFGRELTEQMICAGFENGGKDSCQGDSGGPMVCKIGGIQKLVGVVSWGESCGLPNRPGVYARIQSVRLWINKRTGV